MLYELILLSLSLNGIKALQKIQNVEEKTHEFRVSNCAKAIAQTYFLQTQNVEIISQDRIYGFENFGIVIKSTSEFLYPDLRTSLTKYGVIFLKGNNYQEDLRMLSALERYDPQGKFIVSIENKTDISSSWEKYMKRITFYLASIERWNVVILISDTGSRMIRMYTYTMFSSGNCRREPNLVDHGSNCDHVVTLNNLFPAFVNFHKCPIHLFTKEFPPFSIVYEVNGETQIRGIESNLVKLIVAKLNATYEVFQVADGATVRNSAKTRKADLAWSCLLQYQVTGAVWSQSYMINKVLVVIPQSRLMPLWMNLVLPFQTEVWTGLGTLICVPLSVKVLIPSIRREFHLEWMLSGFFGIGIPKLPERLSHRLYLLSWTIFGYVVMQSYSASLTGFFASPGQYRQMQTLNELEKSKIVTGALENMKGQLAQTNPGLSRGLKVLSEAEYFENIAKLAARTGGIASYIRLDGVRVYHFFIILVLNITRGQESEFIVIPEYVNVYPLAMLLPNSSLILAGCNRVIQHVRVSGLVRFWHEHFISEMNSDFKSRDEDSTQKTSFTHLEAAFFILCVGYCISGIIFASELVLAKFRKYFLENAS